MKEMKSIAAALGAVTSYLFGGWPMMVQVLVFLVATDYLTGLMAAGVEGKLSSDIGRKGIFKKVGIFCLVAVAHKVDSVIGNASIFRDATVFFYCGNELLSIIENIGRTGLPVPGILKQAVQTLKAKGEANETPS